jgi:hypothetical protein
MLAVEAKAKTAYSPIRHLAWVLWGNHDPGRCFVAELGAFFDASGRSDDKTVPALFVSGFVSSEKKWLRFETEWLSLLTEYDIPRPFRMSKFYADYRDRPEARAAFLRAALRIIKRGTYKSFSSGVFMEAHKQASKQYVLPPVIADPFALCGLKVIAQVGIWIRNQNVTKPIIFVFESGDLGRGNLLKAVRGLKVGLEPIFASKKNIVAFDPADMVAWVHARLARRYLEGKRQDEIMTVARELSLQLPGRDRWGA